MLRILLQQRLEVVIGVVAHRCGAVHHELGLRQHLTTGVSDEKVVGQMSDEKTRRSKDDNQDQIELSQQFHWRSSNSLTARQMQTHRIAKPARSICNLSFCHDPATLESPYAGVNACAPAPASAAQGGCAQRPGAGRRG